MLLDRLLLVDAAVADNKLAAKSSSIVAKQIIAWNKTGGE